MSKRGSLSSPSEPIRQGPDADLEFLRAHYGQLFERNEKAQQTRWNFLQLSLGAAAAFYAGMFGSALEIGGLFRFLAGVLPICLATLGYYHAAALREGMRVRGRVMRSIEDRFEVVGWQAARHLDRKRAAQDLEKQEYTKKRAEEIARSNSERLHNIALYYWTIFFWLAILADFVLLAQWLKWVDLR